MHTTEQIISNQTIAIVCIPLTEYSPLDFRVRHAVIKALSGTKMKKKS